MTTSYVFFGGPADGKVWPILGQPQEFVDLDYQDAMIPGEGPLNMRKVRYDVVYVDLVTRACFCVEPWQLRARAWSWHENGRTRDWLSDEIAKFDLLHGAPWWPRHETQALEMRA